MGKYKEELSCKQLVEKLQKHGIHAELVKPRTKLSIYPKVFVKGCLPNQKVSWT
ncbi:hypothetical protein [Anoxybacteroides rupiense]|uniref:hypothetical protein n=1 Tax=Anoxybacteroides rupiense TaxID=311460 RepID=UPI001605ED13|nr:hypothetical protein [Anoxybacillus rupiensis]MBB3909085.1 hypothetical protein [Anoxybacillus rupiensis]